MLHARGNASALSDLCVNMATPPALANTLPARLTLFFPNSAVHTRRAWASLWLSRAKVRK